MPVPKEEAVKQIREMVFFDFKRKFNRTMDVLDFAASDEMSEGWKLEDGSIVNIDPKAWAKEFGNDPEDLSLRDAINWAFTRKRPTQIPASDAAEKAVINVEAHGNPPRRMTKIALDLLVHGTEPGT